MAKRGVIVGVIALAILLLLFAWIIFFMLTYVEKVP